ncbi:hypothetical protein BGW80DRAFT_55820 [Lactifluus volemus]|nr:hypothetical protein BGW80DRAFT_55820 [Lactifluus volemus]
MSRPPSTNGPRKLIIMFDGIEFDMKKLSNLHKLCGLFNNGSKSQVVYFQPGYHFPNLHPLDPYYTTVIKKLDKHLDWYLSVHLHDAYKWLMQEYCIGDKILLFGIARGAYLARALAGMLSRLAY